MQLDHQAKAMRKVNSRPGSSRPDLTARSPILRRPRVLTFKGLQQAARGEKEAVMYSSTYLSWLKRLLILGVIVAGLTASAAGARIDPGVDGGLRWQWEHQMHSPGTASQYPTSAGLKADGLRWQGIAHVYKQQQSVRASGGSSFDWNDYAIGSGTGLGVALFLAAGLLIGRHQRHRPQPA
jgi:hypothetical protein